MGLDVWKCSIGQLNFSTVYQGVQGRARGEMVVYQLQEFGCNISFHIDEKGWVEIHTPPGSFSSPLCCSCRVIDIVYLQCNTHGLGCSMCMYTQDNIISTFIWLGQLPYLKNLGLLLDPGSKDSKNLIANYLSLRLD